MSASLCLCLSFFLFLFQPFSLILCLSLCQSFTANRSLFTSLCFHCSSFILVSFLSSSELVFFSSFRLFPAPLMSPSLASFSISFRLSLSSVFSALQTNCNKPYIKSVTVSSPDKAALFGKSTLCVHILVERTEYRR